MKHSDNKNTTRRSGLEIMAKLIGLIKPLLPIMLLAITLGVLGFLFAISLTILAGYGLFEGVFFGPSDLSIGMPGLKGIFTLIITFAVLRGILHYAEQYCNHFIAFKLLAIIRHKVFAKLRQLSPAKLEGKDKGDLISVITSDIELLEVFYAHTISPIAIAVITSLVMLVFIAQQSVLAALLALVAYLCVGVLIPLTHGKKGAADGMELREGIGELNGFVLDSLRGLDETIQYAQGNDRLTKIKERSEAIVQRQKKLNHLEASQRSSTTLAILIFSFLMLLLMGFGYLSGQVDYTRMLIAVFAMMGSFGPVVALANLSNNLHHTLASGERVLSILEESPKVEEVFGEAAIEFENAELDDIDFAYEEETILKNYSMRFEKGKIFGIHGVSGSGKSTVLKLLMRFWDVDRGSVRITDRDIKKINTADLRNMQSYVTQDTHLFNDTLAHNIAIGRSDATREEIEAAAKKASIHEFISALPNGYETVAGELGDTLSGGERQRIGIARAFLHDAPFLLLDEPTSNLDALNEGIILRSLYEECDQKTVILVSHRKSTMNIADEVYHMKEGRIS